MKKDLKYFEKALLDAEQMHRNITHEISRYKKKNIKFFSDKMLPKWLQKKMNKISIFVPQHVLVDKNWENNCFTPTGITYASPRRLTPVIIKTTGEPAPASHARGRYVKYDDLPRVIEWLKGEIEILSKPKEKIMIQLESLFFDIVEEIDNEDIQPKARKIEPTTPQVQKKTVMMELLDDDNWTFEKRIEYLKTQEKTIKEEWFDGTYHGPETTYTQYPKEFYLPKGKAYNIAGNQCDTIVNVLGEEMIFGDFLRIITTVPRVHKKSRLTPQQMVDNALKNNYVRPIADLKHD
jgi:hypothetical protein